MDVDSKTISKLAASAAAKQQWPLAAAAQALLADPESLDRRINLAGAMHEVGLLKNSIAPYWAGWRTRESGWTQRCCERQAMQHDWDHWALAGLLGASARDVMAALSGLGLPLLAVRTYERFGAAPVQLGIFGLRKSESIVAPLLELGADPDSGEVIDAMRWRAVTLSDEAIAAGTLPGNHTGAYFLRARLPHGCWRVLHDAFVLDPQQMIAVEESLFG